MISPKSFIVVHHSLTADGDTVSWSAIRDYHVKTNGWRDIGYHLGIEKINGRYEVLLGRIPDEVGAHCKDADMNSRGIGICCVGNFDEEVPSLELLTKLKEVCLWLMKTYKIYPDDIIGHREAQAMAGVPTDKRKSCPGRMFNMERLRDELRALLPTA